MTEPDAGPRPVDDAGAGLGRARPQVVGHPTGDRFLVEGGRHRLLSDAVATALVGLLGPTVALDPDEVVGWRASDAAEVLLTPSGGFDALVACVPRGASVVVGGAATRTPVDGAGRRIHRIRVQRPAHNPTGKPPDGLGVLDQLVLARARGSTHLLLPRSSAPWLTRFPDLSDHLARLATVVAANGDGALWALPPVPPSGSPKVFCIGLTKTGTSSLHVALSQLGLRSFHWGDLEAHPVAGTAGLAAAEAIRDAQRNGERLLNQLGEDYDAYSDIGALSARFDLADVQYPGSRFILTVRDVDDWIDSRWRQVELHRRQHRSGMYQGSSFAIDEADWRAEGQAHRDRVETYFADRDDLLVLDICAGDGWDRLAPFLSCPVPATPFPAENVKDRRPASPRPHLVRRRDGAVFLIEDSRRRALTARTSSALEQVLGEPDPIAPGALEALAESTAPAVELARPEGVEPLIDCAPPGSTVVIASPGPTTLPERSTHHIVLPPSASVTGEPPDGTSALDQIVSAWSRGGTHLLLPASTAGWMRGYPDLAGHLGRRATILAGNDAGVLWALPPPPPTGDPKVFCIGLTKTGTQAVHRALTQLGLRSFHGGVLGDEPGARPEGRAPGTAVRDAHRDGERLLRYLGEDHDAYSDIRALSVRFDVADVQYPGSRFVLTVNDGQDGPEDPERSAHRARVEAYFADRDDLLVLDVNHGDGWERLAPFLGRPVPTTPFPRRRRPGGARRLRATLRRRLRG